MTTQHKKPSVGLWIDHAQAVIVTLNDKLEDVQLIASNVARQPRRAGGAVSTIPEPVPPDDQAERVYVSHLNNYYDRVITHLRGAEAMLIFGPGEAKGELQKRLEESGLGRRIVGVETADKMSERQIVAKVRKFFTDKSTGEQRWNIG